MTRVLYWSDLHLGHPFVAGLRGFATTAEHDEHLLSAWTETVSKRDTVFILGDLCMASPNRALELLAGMPGRKHLILGNHDRAHPMYPGGYKRQRRYLEVFESVSTMAARKIAGTDVMLSHFPYDGDSQGDDRHTVWRLRDEGRWLIHGHVHNEYLRSGRQINVSVDRWLDGPVEESVLAAMITEGQRPHTPGA